MSTTTRDTPTRRVHSAEETKRRIEDTAEALFRTVGYQKTTVADIARELGMSPANIYRFYPSKSAINEAIAARMLGGVEDEIWAIARGQATAPDRLTALLTTLHKRHISLFFKQRRLHDMVTAAMAEHWDVIGHFVESIRTAIRHVLMDGMARGEFARLDPEMASATVKMAVIGFVHPVLIAECGLREVTEAEMARDLEAMIGLLLRGLRPDRTT